MDWKEIIFTPEFKEYRKRQTEVIARAIHAELSDVNPDRLNGMLSMANKIIKLPSTLIKGEQYKSELKKLITKDLTDISIKLVRERINP